MMFRLPNPIIGVLCLLLLYYTVFTSPSPYYLGGDDDNSLCHASSDTVSLLLTPNPKTRKLLFLGRGNAIATSVIIFITLLNIIVYKLLQLQDANCGEKLTISSSSSSSSGEVCRRFSLADILSATNNFDESLVIGRGGFGKVYKGVVDNGTTTVAIKRLNSLSKQGAPEFWNEIVMLSKFRHSHLVSLIGYCDIYNEMVLVYEYMPNGTIADHLHKFDTIGQKSPLSWVQRLKISIGAARGLDYLHTGTGVKHRVIHRDVKSSNILLDENWAAKISDFGLSKIGPADQSCTHVSTYVKGTCGYMDPEYLLTRRLTRKSDVYSFGVVLFEVLCGRPAMDRCLPEDQRGLARWAKICIKEGTVDQIIDPNLRGLILPNCLSEFVHIASKCLHSRPKKRPTMTEVLGSLEYALALQERRDSSMVEEEEVFNAVGTYHYQEHVHSSIQQEVINADNSEHQGEKIDGILQLDNTNCGQSPPLPARQMRLKPSKIKMISQKVRVFFSVRHQVIPDGVVRQEPPSGQNATTNSNTFMLVQPKMGNPERPTESQPPASEPPSEQIATANLKKFTLVELKIATNNFSWDLQLGKGGFGSMFKGWINEETYAPSQVGTGMAVAVKKLLCNSLERFEWWQSKVQLFEKFRHPNLVKLLGYCWEDKELLIVYGYMRNGSLDKHLFGGVVEGAKLLAWDTRLEIAIGVARGLSFLHSTENKVIHRDVKASNILLDRDFNAKLSGFEWARLGPIEDDTHVSTGVAGTLGYLAPEYMTTGHLNAKSDVYSLGVVLLEILTGLRALDLFRYSKQINLVNFLADETKLEGLIDKRLENAYPPKGVFQLAALVLKCMESHPNNRPSSEEVLKTLEQIKSSGWN